MRFWDTSALLPLLVAEEASAAIAKLLTQDDDMVVWWASETECVSAVARLEREGALDEKGIAEVLIRLGLLKKSWFEVQPVDGIRTTARRLLRTHALRAADSLQLAAAIAASESDPASLDIVCLDERLRVAASREGFSVLPT